MISIERRTAAGEKGKTVPVIEEFNLPPSVASVQAEEMGQGRLPKLGEVYGFKLNESLWKDIKRHNVARHPALDVLPRAYPVEWN